MILKMKFVILSCYCTKKKAIIICWKHSVFLCKWLLFWWLMNEDKGYRSGKYIYIHLIASLSISNSLFSIQCCKKRLYLNNLERPYEYIQFIYHFEILNLFIPDGFFLWWNLKDQCDWKFVTRPSRSWQNMLEYYWQSQG